MNTVAWCDNWELRSLWRDFGWPCWTACSQPLHRSAPTNWLSTRHFRAKRAVGSSAKCISAQAAGRPQHRRPPIVLVRRPPPLTAARRRRPLPVPLKYCGNRSRDALSSHVTSAADESPTPEASKCTEILRPEIRERGGDGLVTARSLVNNCWMGVITANITTWLSAVNNRFIFPFDCVAHIYSIFVADKTAWKTDSSMFNVIKGEK